MIRQYKKGQVLQLSEHLHLKEVDCKCTYPDCQSTYISDVLIQAFEQLRSATGALIVLSGYRCEQHNEDVGGKIYSLHKLGCALDLTSKIRSRHQLFKAAKRVLDFSQSGLGLYQWGIHADVGRGKPVRWYG